MKLRPLFLQRPWCFFFFVRRCREGMVGFFDTSSATTAALLVLLFSLLLWMLLRCYVCRFTCDCSFCCCFVVAFAALLLLSLLRCLSPVLHEIEGNTPSPPNPPDRPASNHPVLDSPWTALPWTALRQTTQNVVVFCSHFRGKKNAVSPLSWCLPRFYFLLFFGVLTLSGSLVLLSNPGRISCKAAGASQDDPENSKGEF